MSEARSLRCALIVGASGGIGDAIVRRLLEGPKFDRIVCTGRRCEGGVKHQNVVWMKMDLQDESSIEQVVQAFEPELRFELVVVATGILHQKGVFPERSFHEMSAASLNTVLQVNCIGPALVAKYFVPKLVENERSLFVCLGARIGSISDNRAGGWYAYRASKAALVMVLKTLAIELRRTHPKAIVAALHPGTVRSALSAPFVREGSRRVTFSAQESAAKLLSVIESLAPEHSGMHLAYDGRPIEP